MSFIKVVVINNGNASNKQKLSIPTPPLLLSSFPASFAISVATAFLCGFPVVGTIGKSSPLSYTEALPQENIDCLVWLKKSRFERVITFPWQMFSRVPNLRLERVEIS